MIHQTLIYALVWEDVAEVLPLLQILSVKLHEYVRIDLKTVRFESILFPALLILFVDLYQSLTLFFLFPDVFSQTHNLRPIPLEAEQALTKFRDRLA